MQKHHIISYNKQSIQLLIKKNKLSKNYKLTFDKKNLRGLVSIPNYVSFKSGLKFANENAQWLYKEINKILPIVLIKCILKIIRSSSYHTKVIIKKFLKNGLFVKF